MIIDNTRHGLNSRGNSRTLVLIALFAVSLLGVQTAPAATLMNLFAKVTFGIEVNGSTLPDNSVVYIVGSLDSVIDPMQSFGTNYIAESTTGDDEILATVRIGQGVLPTTGRFIWSGLVQRYTNVYIRFFDSTADPVVGYTNWGESLMSTVQFIPFGGAVVDFAPNTNLYADRQDNFVVIPEPGAASLFLFGAGLLGLLRRRLRR